MFKIFLIKNTFIILILLLHLIFWMWLKPPVPQTDDLCYVQEGEKFLNGIYQFNDSPKNHRLVVILPALLFTQLFGVNSFAISLWSLVCSLATISILFVFLKKIDLELAIISSLLVSLNIVQVIYSTVLFPDIIVSFFALLVMLMIFSGRENHEEKKYAFATVIFLIIGFFTKEIIILLLPLILFLSITDLKKKQSEKFWKFFYMWFSIALVMVLITSKILKDDFFFLYNCVEKNHNEVFISGYNLNDLLKRITYEPVVWLNNQLGYIFLFILAVPAIIEGLKKNNRFQNLESFFSIYFIGLLSVYWFGSSSVTKYAPILLLDRMWLLLIIPLCVLCAVTIKRLIRNELSSRSIYFLISVLFLLALLNGMKISMTRGVLFAIFGMSVIMLKFTSILWNQNIFLKKVILLAPFVLLIVYFLVNNTNYR